MMEIPDALLVAFPPSPDFLLDRARRQTDDAMLMVIAEADYGLGADEMLAELRSIRDKGFVAAYGTWNFGEALTLSQYSDPDAPAVPQSKPGSKGRRGHQTRLFACALLLRGEAEWPDQGFDSILDSTLAQCLVSANVLGEEMNEAAACFLTWRLSRRESGYGALVFTVGLLILATRLRSGRFSEPILGTIAEWVLEQESLEQREFFPPDPGDQWPASVSFQTGFWGALAAELKTVAEAIRDDEVGTKLQLCALILEDPYS